MSNKDTAQEERPLRLGPVVIYAVFTIVFPVWLGSSLWYGEWMTPFGGSHGIIFAIIGVVFWVITTILMYWLFTTDMDTTTNE